MISFFFLQRIEIYTFFFFGGGGGGGGGGGEGGVEWKGCSVAWVSEFFLQIIQL